MVLHVQDNLAPQMPIVSFKHMMGLTGGDKDEEDGLLAPTEKQRYDGWYNNLAHPDWGAVESQLTRRAPPSYADGVYEMGGARRPGARLLSQALMRGGDGLPSRRNLTALFAFFGQVVASEVLMASESGCPHRGAQDRGGRLRRRLRQGVPGRTPHALPQGALRPQDGAVAQQPQGTAEPGDELGGRQLRVQHERSVGEQHEELRERHLPFHGEALSTQEPREGATHQLPPRAIPRHAQPREDVPAGRPPHPPKSRPVVTGSGLSPLAQCHGSQGAGQPPELDGRRRLPEGQAMGGRHPSEKKGLPDECPKLRWHRRSMRIHQIGQQISKMNHSRPNTFSNGQRFPSSVLV
ncbi:dual oxidase [Caerostris extrusa]|uniref:Dual oxidase n=1 Tax=Caerostris extrusa TaxID=172846 RepID=A0AAV4YAM7_CAEEX|nr:dual oxidase [Caerostris extrusa]